MTVVSLELRKDGAVMAKSAEVVIWPNGTVTKTYVDSTGARWDVVAAFTDLPVSRVAAVGNPLDVFETTDLLDEVKRRVEADRDAYDESDEYE